MYSDIYANISTLGLKSLNKVKTVRALNRLGINTLYDLVYFFPRAYENSAKLKKISSLKDGENVVLEGRVLNVQNNLYSKKPTTTVLLSDGDSVIELLWFNSRYISKAIFPDMDIRVTGKVKRSMRLQMINPSYVKITEKNRNANINEEDKLDGIYSLTSDVTQKEMRNILYEAMNKYLNVFEENLPKEYILKYKLMDRTKALINIHFPKDKEGYKEAKRRMIYEEALILEMKILKNRYNENLKNSNIYVLDDNKDLVKKYISSLPFELTKSQKGVITEIYRELKSGKVINRLIQGDVGSGKTVVSLILLLYMVANGYQGVMMAPTEILATQHYLDMVDKFKELGVNVVLLTGSIKGKKKEKILEEIASGQANIVIGTHSLIEDNVNFHSLGLIVIDEQHKFGVEQRNRIRDKGIYSNLIVMSATPIPRSLALTVYGDLDVSIIRQMPLGRKPIITKWVKTNDEETIMYSFVKEKLKEGRQAYVVAPLIEKSEKLKLSSAEEIFEKFKSKFPKNNVGLLHGKLKTKEKDEIMRQFKDKELDILISTTVVEVGVNVPNSSVMIIFSSERFGLSSLHQLRGRVGRGEYESYCFLVSKTNNEMSTRRLSVMEETTDGFLIAEEDLKLRDSGEIFGMKQSGLSEFRLLDIVSNFEEIAYAKNFCEEYLCKSKGEILEPNLYVDIINLY